MTSRIFLATILLLTAACAQDGYTYKPNGVALSHVEMSSGTYKITWSKEWREWASANEISLLGFYLTEPDCDGDQLHKMVSVAFIQINASGGLMVSVDGNKKAFHCPTGASRLVLYPKFETKGYDSEEWVLPTSIQVR